MKRADPEWYRDLYRRRAYLRLYEAIDRESAAGEAAAAARLLGLRAGDRVLDVACGFGRHVAELDRLGFQAWGVDLSDVLLDRAVEYAAEHRLPRRYVRGDIRALPFARGFDGALNFFVSFGYLSDSENQQAANEIARVIRPGGCFLLDTWNGGRVLASLQPKIIEEREDAVIVERSRYLRRSKRLEWFNEVRFHGGERERWSQSVRVYTLAEWRLLFAEAGFRQVDAFGDWDESPFAEDSPRLVLRASA